MFSPHLILALASAAPATFEGAPLPVAESIFQIELQRMPPSALTSYFADANPAVRALAVQAAGRLRAPAALLSGPAADAVAEVRLKAAYALAASPDSQRLVRARLESETDPRVRSALWFALGRVGESADVPLVRAELKGAGAAAAAEALGRLAMRRVEGASTEATALALLDVLSFPIGEARRNAAWALSRAPLDPLSAAARARLEAAALRDTDLRVRAWLIRAVSTQGDNAKFFAAASRDTEAPVRLAAVRGMAKAGCDAAALEARLEDESAWVREEALTTAASCEGVPLDPIRDALASGTSSERAAALRTLDERRALPAAIADFTGESWPLAVRIAAVELTHDRPRLLRVALRGSDPRLRSAAAGALLSGEDPPRTNEIIELLGADDPLIAQAAADAGEKTPDPSMERPLLGVLARKNLARPTAIATVRALSALYATGRLPRPSAEAADKIRPWLGVPELSAVRGPLSSVLGLPEPKARHPDRTLPTLAEVLRIRSARVLTSEGELRIELMPELAPYTVWNFASLAERGYFDGLTFHRVVPDFVVQTGDPRGDGWGGPGFEIPDEINPTPYKAGTVGMALSGPDTGGSQWFVTTAPQPHLDFGYTVFGALTAGLRSAQAIDVEDRITRVIVERVP